MITERQEQIENGIEVLRNAEDHLNCTQALPNYRAIDLLARLRVELAIEWDQIEAEKCKR
jgi:hypothetical protein